MYSLYQDQYNLNRKLKKEEKKAFETYAVKIKYNVNELDLTFRIIYSPIEIRTKRL
jgi:hypothetical protein